MANLSGKASTPPAKADSKPAAPVLTFVDAERPPTAAELNKSSNPFQEKVNELARSGKAASFVASKDTMDGLINQFRAACSNIEMGGRVRKETIPGDDANMRIHIWVTDKREKKSSK